MFKIEKTAATAVKRVFGARPVALIVSSHGVLHNYVSTVRVPGSSPVGAEHVALRGADAVRFIAAIHGGGVTVEVCGDTVAVETSVGRVSLEGEDASGYTNVSAESFGAPSSEVPLSKSEWSALYQSTSADDTVPILQSVAVLRDNGGILHAASTDRYRLTAIDINDRATVGGEFGKTALVGRTIVATAKALPVKTTATIVVGAEVDGRRAVGFTSDLFDVWALEVEGDYPKVLSLFPKDPRERFRVQDSKGVGATVKSMAAHIVLNAPIRVRVNGGAVELLGGDGDSYEGRVSVAAEVLDAEDHATGFNPLFLAQAFAMAGKGSVTLHQGEPRKSAVLTFDAAPSMRHLIMPIVRF